MKIGVLVAVVQPMSAGHQAAALLANWAAQQQIELCFIDLSSSRVPLWDKLLTQDIHSHLPAWRDIQNQLDALDALYIISPEWDEVILQNSYLLWRLSSQHRVPGIVIRLESGSRGDYNARDLMMVNYRDNQQVLVLEQLNWPQQMLREQQVNAYQLSRLSQSHLLLQQTVGHGWLRFAAQVPQPASDTL